MLDLKFCTPCRETRQLVGRAAYQLCQDLLALEGHLYLPAIEINKQRTMTETWELTAKIKRALVPFEEQSKKKLIELAFTKLIERISDGLPEISILAEDEWASLSVPLYVLLPDPVRAIETVLGIVFNEELIQAGFFEHLRFRLDYNINIASGINPVDPAPSVRDATRPGSREARHYRNGREERDHRRRRRRSRRSRSWRRRQRVRLCRAEVLGLLARDRAGADLRRVSRAINRSDAELEDRPGRRSGKFRRSGDRRRIATPDSRIHRKRET